MATRLQWFDVWSGAFTAFYRTVLVNTYRITPAAGVTTGGHTLKKEPTRSTLEVAHFCYFVCERRGFFTPSRGNVNLDSDKKNSFLDSGHEIIRRDEIRFLLQSVFG